MIEKIISAGQTGVESAALEFAVTAELQTGGIVPKGWMQGATEVYASTMTEHDGFAYPPCIEQNVKDADGTLVIGRVGVPPASLSRRAAIAFKKPLIANPTAEELKQWVSKNSIKTLHVSGTRTTDLDPDMETMTFALLLQSIGALDG